MDALLHDARYAFRHLRRAPWFSAAAILTLAFGIGANTAMFTMLNALVIRPLPIKDPEGLIAVTGRNQQDQLRQTLITAVPELQRDGPFGSVCAINGNGVFAADVGGVPTQAVIAVVTGRCFEVFGVNPVLGRVITDDDAPLTRAGNRVAVIGYPFWTRMFNRDANVLGKTIRMDGIALEIIGVMPRDFVGIQADFGIDVYFPNYTVTPMRPDRPAAATQVLGRLKPGVSLEQARTELSARWTALTESTVPAGLAAPLRALYSHPRVRVEEFSRGTSFHRDRFARPITIILGLTLSLLLLACVNLGGLLLSRLAERGPELGIRLALGGSRGRVALQMIVESLMLSLSGALLAVPASFAFVNLLASFLPVGLVQNQTRLEPDLSVFALTALCGLAAALLMSSVTLVLAWRRTNVVSFAWDRTVVAHSSRVTRLLLVTQVALSVVLLTGAGLMIRSVYLLQRADVGLRTDRVLNAKIMPLPDGYRGIDNATYYRALSEQLLQIPGVRGVGFSRAFPRVLTEFVGQPIAPVGEPFGDRRAQLESASPGFFDTVGIPLLRGRFPAWTDHSRSQPVAVVSESLARVLAPTGDLIGRHFKLGVEPAHQDVEIVGIVGNATLGNPREAAVPVFYRPMLQAGAFANYPNIQIATDGDPLVITSAVDQAVRSGGREYVHELATIERLLQRAPSGERMTAAVAAAIAALAVTLAFIGLYGALAYDVSRRKKEIGVRVALGASRTAVTGMVINAGLRLTLIGLAVGVPAAIASARVLRTMMYGVSEHDPATLAACVALFIVTGATAGLVPALRAANVDPAVALRAE